MKKFPSPLSCIKQDVYIILFYFLRQSHSDSSHSLRHPTLGLSTSLVTVRYRAQPFLSGRCPFCRMLLLGIQISLYLASSHFGTQQQLTHPVVKSSTLPLKKMPVFQGVDQTLGLGIQISLYPVSSLFRTNQQLTHPSVKSSTFPL